MLTDSQNQRLNLWFSFTVDELLSLEPQLALSALNSIFDDMLYENIVDDLAMYDGALEALEDLRDVFQHPCPQNRPVDPTCPIQEEGMSVWFDDASQPHTEPAGIMGLTALDDKPIDPSDVCERVQYLLEEVLSAAEDHLQRIQDAVATDLDENSYTVSRCEELVDIATKLTCVKRHSLDSFSQASVDSLVDIWEDINVELRKETESRRMYRAAVSQCNMRIDVLRKKMFIIGELLKDRGGIPAHRSAGHVSVSLIKPSFPNLKNGHPGRQILFDLCSSVQTPQLVKQHRQRQSSVASARSSIASPRGSLGGDAQVEPTSPLSSPLSQLTRSHDLESRLPTPGSNTRRRSSGQGPDDLFNPEHVVKMYKDLYLDVISKISGDAGAEPGERATRSSSLDGWGARTSTDSGRPQVEMQPLELAVVANDPNELHSHPPEGLPDSEVALGTAENTRTTGARAAREHALSVAAVGISSVDVAVEQEEAVRVAKSPRVTFAEAVEEAPEALSMPGLDRFVADSINEIEASVISQLVGSGQAGTVYHESPGRPQGSSPMLSEVESPRNVSVPSTVETTENPFAKEGSSEGVGLGVEDDQASLPTSADAPTRPHTVSAEASDVATPRSSVALASPNPSALSDQATGVDETPPYVVDTSWRSPRLSQVVSVSTPRTVAARVESELERSRQVAMAKFVHEQLLAPPEDSIDWVQSPVPAAELFDGVKSDSKPTPRLSVGPPGGADEPIRKLHFDYSVNQPQQLGNSMILTPENMTEKLAAPNSPVVSPRSSSIGMSWAAVQTTPSLHRMSSSKPVEDGRLARRRSTTSLATSGLPMSPGSPAQGSPIMHGSTAIAIMSNLLQAIKPLASASADAALGELTLPLRLFIQRFQDDRRSLVVDSHFMLDRSILMDICEIVGHDSSTVASLGCTVLGVFAERVDNRHLMIQCGVVGRVIRSMGLHEGDVEVHESALATLAVLAFEDDDAQHTITLAGGVRRALDLASATYAQHRIVEEAMHLLCNLSHSEEVKESMLLAVNIKKLLKAIQAHCNNRFIVVAGCTILQNIAFVDYSDSLCRTEALEVVGDTMRGSLRADEEVMDAATSALSTLLLLDGCRDAFVGSEDSLDIVVNTMMNTVHFPAVQINCCTVIGRLRGMTSGVFDLLVARGCLEALVKTMTHHRDTVAVQEEAVIALSAFEAKKYLKEFLREGVVESVVGALNRFSDCTDIQVHGSDLLIAVAAVDSDCHKFIRMTGGGHVVAESLRRSLGST